MSTRKSPGETTSAAARSNSSPPASHSESLAASLAALHRQTVVPAVVDPSDASGDHARHLRDYAADATVALPMPILDGALADALRERRSERAMRGTPLSLEELSSLLAFGAGTAGQTTLPASAGAPVAGRTYPSGGALYPIELLACIGNVESVPSGVYRYQVLAHRLAGEIPRRPMPAGIQVMLHENGVTEGASLALLLYVDWSQSSLERYGILAYRLALLEAGHIAQNLLLVAASRGVAAVSLCGFDDAALSEQCGLRYPEQVIVYAIVFGRAA